MADNVVVLSFEEASRAYQALSVLKQGSFEGKVAVSEAAVVTREADGRLKFQDGASAGMVGSSMAAGTLIGALVGVLGGPIGVLLGSSFGLLVGSAVGADDALDTATVLGQVIESIPVGATALVALVDESDPAVIDTEAAKLQGVVLRRPVADVQAEVDAAVRAQIAAEREVHKVLREQHRADRRQKIDEWKHEVSEGFEHLKDRLSGGSKG